MPEAYVVEAVRTAVGKRNGSLAGVHPIDLGVAAFHGLFERVDVDPAAVDDVVVGCVDAIGIWLMFCMPPARIRSAVFAMIACAPKEIAC